MAGHVALAQALSYASDLKALQRAAAAREAALTEANARLRAAHRQGLRYAEDLKKTLRRVEGLFLHSLEALAKALEARDEYTRGHSERVAELSRRLALAAGLPAPAAALVAQAARLHDLGKIGIPEAVLRKPGPLDPGEWEVMRGHPLIGARILAPLDFFVEGASIVRHHHERHDGSGYPDGLGGDRVPVGARIVAVADVFDALTSDRPYRPRLSREAALRRLRREAGRTLDGELIALFVELLGDAPADRPV